MEFLYDISLKMYIYTPIYICSIKPSLQVISVQENVIKFTLKYSSWENTKITIGKLTYLYILKGL